MRPAKSGDPVVNELSWYHHLAEHETEVEFMEAAAPWFVLSDAPIDLGWLGKTRKARTVRQTLARLPDGHQRVISAAFEPRAYRHCWQRFSKFREVELATVAVRTARFRGRFAEEAGERQDYTRRWAIVDAWADEMGRVHSRNGNVDGLEAFALSLGDPASKKVHPAIERAAQDATELLKAALDAYSDARGWKRQAEDKVAA